MTDYYPILMRAVGSLEPNTAAARADLFARARSMIVNKIRTEGSRWTQTAIDDEIGSFDSAVERIESEFGYLDARAMPRREPLRASREVPREAPRKREPLSTRPTALGRSGLIGAGAVAAVLVGGLLVYAFSGRDHAPAPKASEPMHEAAQETPAPARQTLDANELAPGVDGGSNDSGLPYFFRRQAVYYRSVYSEGMIVIDRSQRYLYLIQPQSRAWRYGIGVGGECPVMAGFQRIKEKVQWPEWTASAEQIKRGYPPRLPGGPGNPLGARVLYFDRDVIGIHGTNAPKTIGEAVSLGCIRMVNDDVVDLANRVTIGAGVVVLN